MQLELLLLLLTPIKYRGATTKVQTTDALKSFLVSNKKPRGCNVYLMTSTVRNMFWLTILAVIVFSSDCELIKCNFVCFIKL